MITLSAFSERQKGYIALVVVYIVWGTTFGALRIGVETFPPALLVCLRFGLAGVFLILLCRIRGEAWPDKHALWHNAVVGFLLLFCGNSIVCWVVKNISTGLAGTLVATSAFWMSGLAAILPPKEPIPKQALLGLGIGFLGILVLLSPQLLHPLKTTPLFWTCIAITMVMLFCWSLGSIYARKFPTRSSVVMDVGLQNAFAGLFLLPVTWVTIGHWHGPVSAISLGALFYLILFGSMLASPCYLYTLQKLPVSLSSTFSYVTPVITVIFGALFLGEQLTVAAILGTAIILIGVLWVQRANSSKSVPTEIEITPSITHSGELPMAASDIFAS